MTGESGGEAEWWGFMRRHWGILAVFAVAGALAFVGAVVVFLWFVGNAQSTGLVPATLGQWSMANLVTFILYSIFWELLLVGVPVAIGFGVGWWWWTRRPSAEREGYRLFGRRSRTTSSGGGLSFLFFIAFCIKVFIDGKWNTPIASFTLDYVVGSMVTILVWGAIIFGIPATIALILWARHEMGKH